MNVEIEQAPMESKPLIEEMMQDYFAELENYAPIGRNDQGRYEYPYLDDYWIETESRFPFLIRVDGEIAGFALVNTHSHLNVPGVRSMAEFCIAPSARRTGIGRRTAENLFRLFPGKWEVAVLEANVPARRFWRSVISSVAFGDVTEHSGVWQGPVFAFQIGSDERS